MTDYGAETSPHLTEMRTILGRAETTLAMLERSTLGTDELAEMLNDVESVISLLSKYRRTVNTAPSANSRCRRARNTRVLLDTPPGSVAEYYEICADFGFLPTWVEEVQYLKYTRRRRLILPALLEPVQRTEEYEGYAGQYRACPILPRCTDCKMPEVFHLPTRKLDPKGEYIFNYSA